MDVTKRSASKGFLWLAIGLCVSGGGNYIYLAIAGQALTDADYAPLGALWSLVFFIAPGLFFPVEQELTRAIATRKAENDGSKPVIIEGFRITFVAVFVVSAASLALTIPLGNALFDGNNWMVAAFACSAFSFASMYFLRGLFAGSQQLVAYGILLSSEAIVRCFIALALWFGGVESPTGYAFALALAPIATAVVLVPAARRLMTAGRPSSRSEISASLGSLVAASLCSQALTNGAPLFAAVVFDSARQNEAGVFIKAYLITRIPIFLFQAVQAVVLPRLTASAVTGDYQSFRRLFVRFLTAISAVGAVGGAFIVLLGDPLLGLFGATTDLAVSQLVVLSVGNLFILLAMAAAQGLIALRKQHSTIAGWAAGLVVFAAGLLLFETPMQRLNVSFCMGATTAALLMIVLAVRNYRSAQGSGMAVNH